MCVCVCVCTCSAYGILVPQPRIEPVPLQWKCAVLTTGQPGNLLEYVFNNTFSSLASSDTLVLPTLASIPHPTPHPILTLRHSVPHPWTDPPIQPPTSPRSPSTYTHMHHTRTFQSPHWSPAVCASLDAGVTTYPSIASSPRCQCSSEVAHCLWLTLPDPSSAQAALPPEVSGKGQGGTCHEGPRSVKPPPGATFGKASRPVGTSLGPQAALWPYQDTSCGLWG